MHEPERTPEQEACDQAAERLNAWLDSLPPAEAERIVAEARAHGKAQAQLFQSLAD